MNLHLDCRKIEDFGIGTYVRGLLAGYADLGEPRPLTLVGGGPRAQELAAAHGFAQVPEPSRPYSLAEQLLLPRRRWPADALWHFPHYVTPLLLRAPHVVTIHDVIHLDRRGDRTPLAYPYALLFLTRALRRARVVITATDDARRRLLALAPDAAPRLRVIPHGIAAEMKAAPSTGERDEARRAAGGPFVLYVGNDLPHKNLPVLVEAFLAIHADLPEPRPRLVVVGPSPSSDRPWRVAAAALGAGRISILGRVASPLLRALYAEADLLAFPSLEEGFGLPPLEAFAQGTPVLAAQTPAVREVLGSLAAYGDGTSVAAFAPALATAIARGRGSHDGQRERQRHAERFSWTAAARATLDAYRDAMLPESG